jgi:hypothetical protein
MSIEFALTQVETALVKLPDAPANVAVSPRAWWGMTQLALGGLLISYLLGMVQDFQRVRDLRAEPSALSKVIITKHEAWQRIYPRPIRSGMLDVGGQPGTAGTLNP